MTEILRPLALLLIFLNLVTAASLLSCRLIANVCQEEPMCLAEMQVSFPHCYYPEPTKRSWEGYGTDKRALKLMNILMKVDRIPVGKK